MTRQPVPPPTKPTAGRLDDWRVFRPAIWMGMIGIAVTLVVTVYLGLALVGAAIGIAARIQISRRRLAAGRPVRRPRRR